MHSLLMVSGILGVMALTAAPEANRWESAIQAFETQDKQQAPPRDAFLFVGSSTIRIWDLKKCFPEFITINRGFGGSEFADSARYADRVIIPYHPKKIVMYAGDNDIAGGKTPDQVVADFQAVLKAIRDGLGDVRVIVLSIKPCPARWEKYDLMRQVNERIAEVAKKDPRLLFVDVGSCVFGADKKPRADLFLKDGLHLNAEGYRMWSDILRPILKAD